MTDKPEEPTLSPYDDGTDPETESFLRGGEDSPVTFPEPEPLEPEIDALPAAADPAAVAEPVGDVPVAGTPEEPTVAVESPTLVNREIPREETTDTIVRRTSLLRPENQAIASPSVMPPAPAALPMQDPYSEYSEYDKVPSRAGSHWWSALSVLILTPIAWYLLADAGARFTLSANSPWDTGVLNYAAIIEFVAGLTVLVVIILALRGSSLGAWITGPLLTLGGATFIAIPSLVQEFLEPHLATLTNYNAFGANLAHHLMLDGSTGRFVIAGVALMAAGSVSHGARRHGRRHQRIADALALHSRMSA